MKKYIFVLPIIIAIVLIVFLTLQKKTSRDKNLPSPTPSSTNQENAQKEDTSMANPASQFCDENGGKLEIVSNSDGSQIGLCNLDEYSCEEWTYYRGECTIKEDEEKIKQALINKGLNLSQSKVVINKHLGKYIGGSVVPVDMLGGGGYVFAAKEDEKIIVLADGNGAIMCKSFEDYPDFPSYLVSECVDDTGNIVKR